MRGGVLEADGLVVTAADHPAVEHHDGADRHLARGQGGPGFVQRKTHEPIVLGLAHFCSRVFHPGRDIG